jgi:hypothetical protein
MICLFCGQKIGQEFPVPVAELRLTPIVPHVPGLTENRLGETRYVDRLCCQNCYKKIAENDFKIIQEAGELRNAH